MRNEGGRKNCGGSPPQCETHASACGRGSKPLTRIGTSFSRIDELRAAALLWAYSCQCLFNYACHSGVRLIDQELAHRVQNLLLRREEKQSLLGYDFFPDADGELAELAFNQLGLYSEFAVQHGRHPGGSRLVGRSGLAVTDGDGAHKRFSQYFGTLGSISSAQASMPPLTFFRYLNPCSRKNRSAFIERMPLLQ